MLFSSLTQPTIPKSPSIAQVHGWPSTLLCLTLCSLWSRRQMKLSLFPQLHPQWPFLQDLQVPSVSQPLQGTRVSLILVTHAPKIWGKCKSQFPPHCHPLLECGMRKLIPPSGGSRSQNVFTLWISVYCLYFKTVNPGLPSAIT